MYPQSAEAGRDAKLEAFLKVDPFRKVLNHYRGSNLPEREYLSNTLITAFDIQPPFHDEFIEIFKHNAQFLEIGDEFVPGSGRSTVAPT